MSAHGAADRDELLTKVDARISGECGRYNWSGRDLTREAKIDRATGVLDTHLAGWATDFTRSTSFGRVSRAGVTQNVDQVPQNVW